MKPTGNHEYDEARRRLVEEGTPSYLEAVTALIEYQREVQKRCRAVMAKHLDDYASALKVRLTSGEIQNFAEPSVAKWEGHFWFLGAKIVRKNIPKIRWWESFLCLGYESGD